MLLLMVKCKYLNGVFLRFGVGIFEFFRKGGGFEPMEGKHEIDVTMLLIEDVMFQRFIIFEICYV